jgi:phage gpG-like protein
MNITYTITGVAEAEARIKGLPQRLRAELNAEMELQIADLTTDVVRNKLSGQVLRAVSGRLRNSIGGRVKDDWPVVTGTTYSAGVPYAKILEYGGKTDPHQIVPTNARALHFVWHGDEVFFSRVNHPGSQIPQFAYLRQSLYDLSDQIRMGFKDAVLRSVQ